VVSAPQPNVPILRDIRALLVAAGVDFPQPDLGISDGHFYE
jgi:hypothetical protein